MELKSNSSKIIKLFLRGAIAAGFLSAVADRFGLWSEGVSAWGNWANFLEYTQVLIPWAPDSLIPIFGFTATAFEIIFAVLLIVGFKTELIAKLSGLLLLLFALSMTFSIGVKGPLDYSVFSASAAAFALSLLKEKYWELDVMLSNPKSE